MTLDEILRLVENNGRCIEGNWDVVKGDYISTHEAKQAIREAIERAEPNFRNIADDQAEAHYNAGYNHALSDYRIALLQELGIDNHQT